MPESRLRYSTQLSAAFALIGLLTTAALASPTRPVGNWGGPRAVVHLTATEGKINVKCAGEGQFDAPLETDSSGIFEVTGTFQFIVLGGLGPAFPVKYIGQVWKGGMAITVASQDPAVPYLRTFLVRRNRGLGQGGCLLGS